MSIVRTHSNLMGFMRAFLVLLLCLITLPAHAQTASDRIDQLEEDVMLLKRQQERTRISGGGSSEPAAGDVGGNAQANVRITALEEEIRSLRGVIEQKDFEVKRVSDELARLKSDVEFRLGELEKSG